MLGIKKDDTTIEVFEEIAELYKKEFGKEINTDIVYNVAQSQFFLFEGAFRTYEEIKLDYIGKFSAVEKRIERIKDKFGSLKDNSLPLPVVIFKAQENGNNNIDGLSDRLRQIPNSEQNSGQEDYHTLRNEW